MSGKPDRPIQSFRDLLAWQQGRALVKQVYQATTVFPKEELYGLTNQMRRAAVSVPSNIAEGYGRGHRRDYIRFLQMARASVCELQTQLCLAADLGFLTEAASDSLITEAGRVFGRLQRLIESLERTEGRS